MSCQTCYYGIEESFLWTQGCASPVWSRTSDSGYQNPSEKVCPPEAPADGGEGGGSFIVTSAKSPLPLTGRPPKSYCNPHGSDGCTSDKCYNTQGDMTRLSQAGVRRSRPRSCENNSQNDFSGRVHYTLGHAPGKDHVDVSGLSGDRSDRQAEPENRNPRSRSRSGERSYYHSRPENRNPRSRSGQRSSQYHRSEIRRSRSRSGDKSSRHSRSVVRRSRSRSGRKSDRHHRPEIRRARSRSGERSSRHSRSETRRSRSRSGRSQSGDLSWILGTVNITGPDSNVERSNRHYRSVNRRLAISVGASVSSSGSVRVPPKISLSVTELSRNLEVSLP